MRSNDADVLGVAEEAAAPSDGSVWIRAGRFLRRAAILTLATAAKWIGRFIGALLWVALLVLYLGPPVLLLLLFAMRSIGRPLVIPAESMSTILLTAAGATIALAGLCFSYSRAVENLKSKRAGLEAGRMLMGAAIALSIALAAHFVSSLDNEPPYTAAPAFFEYLVTSTLRFTLALSPALIAIAVIRIYFHLLRLAGISMVDAYDTREAQAERAKLRIFD